MKKNSGKGRGFSIRFVLMALIVPLVAALVFSIAFFSSEMKKIEREDEELYVDQLYEVSSILLNADRDFYQSVFGATQYFMYYNTQIDPDKLAGFLQDFKDNKQQTQDRVAQAAEIAQKNPDLFTGTKGESGMTFEELNVKFNAAFLNWDSSYNVEYRIGNFNTFIACFESARACLGELCDITEEWAQFEKQKKEAELNALIVTTGIIFVVVAVVLLVLALIISNMLTKSIRSVSGSIEVLSGGDFVEPVEVKTKVREFANIASRLEEMRQRLKDALTLVIGHAGNVNSKAEDAKIRISDSKHTTNDITNAVSELAEGATLMAQDVQSTSEITINIGSSVDQVLEAANSNLEKGRTVFENSSQVSAQIDELRQADEVTDRMAGEVAESMTRTSQVVQDITKAAKAIISIASQTNMLALNASIEAARAGEAGKGFVVVEVSIGIGTAVNNIKDLAADSNRAAEQITSMLNTITELSERNMELTTSIKEATSSETTALQDMMDSFTRMQSLLNETEEGNRLIVSLVETLTTDKNSIMSSVESLSSVSEENAASTQETSASLTQLDSNMEAVAEQAESLQKIASELEENVRFFKVS